MNRLEAAIKAGISESQVKENIKKMIQAIKHKVENCEHLICPECFDGEVYTKESVRVWVVDGVPQWDEGYDILEVLWECNGCDQVFDDIEYLKKMLEE